jgi:hypothetical protein
LGGKYISTGLFDMPFNTLKELDEEWNELAEEIYNPNPEIPFISKENIEKLIKFNNKT